MTFSKLYGTLRPGSDQREGAMREADHKRKRGTGEGGGARGHGANTLKSEPDLNNSALSSYRVTEIH